MYREYTIFAPGFSIIQRSGFTCVWVRGMSGRKQGAHMQTKMATGTFPLPDIFGRRNVRRSAVNRVCAVSVKRMRRCVYSDKERVSVCEGWYARLMREGSKGVVG
jgi:hypothetical protein